jgi:hypothetical protein
MVVRRLLVAAAVLAALVFSACGNKKPLDELGRKEAVREGLKVEMGGLTYNVYITRQLNTKDAEDRDYYRGESQPGKTFYGVFMQVCNNSKKPLPAATEFTVTDTLGRVFYPTELPRDNLFAYQGGRVEPQNCIPVKNSAAASAPINGAMLLFELPLESTENRPLELDIVKPQEAGPPDDHIKVKLDI